MEIYMESVRAEVHPRDGWTKLKI